MKKLLAVLLLATALSARSLRAPVPPREDSAIEQFFQGAITIIDPCKWWNVVRIWV